MKSFKILKSIGVNKIIDNALQCRYDSKKFWGIVKEFMIYNTQYDSARDIVDTLQLLMENPTLFE